MEGVQPGCDVCSMCGAGGTWGRGGGWEVAPALQVFAHLLDEAGRACGASLRAYVL